MTHLDTIDYEVAVETQAFTDEEAAYADNALVALMQKKRLFLHKNPTTIPAHYIRYAQCPKALDLNREINEIYADAKKVALDLLESKNKALGIIKPENRSEVSIDRSTGGLAIVQVYPLSMFLKHMPASEEALCEAFKAEKIGDTSMDNLSPNQISWIRSSSRDKAKRIYPKLQALQKYNAEENKSVVVLKTERFASNKRSGHILPQATWDMNEYEEALAHLFHWHSMQQRLIRRGFVLFGSSSSEHYYMQYCRSEKPSLRKTSSGYDCHVYFAAVL